MKRIATAVAAGFLILACTKTSPPPRPASVPKSATWAGGSDGGAWIDCRFEFKEPYVGYHCDVYKDGGAHWASGTYALVDVTFRSNRPIYTPTSVTARVHPEDFEAFDGDVIGLSRSRALVPEALLLSERR
jgi:hypothetical protein